MADTIPPPVTAAKMSDLPMGVVVEAVEDRHMSRIEAVGHLMTLMAGRKLSPEECEAVAMGVRCLVKRHRDRHMNYARRRAAQRQAPEESAGKENDEQS